MIKSALRNTQRQSVTVDHIVSDGEARVIANLTRKAEQADRMFAQLTLHMTNALHIARAINYTKPVEVPPWPSEIVYVNDA